MANQSRYDTSPLGTGKNWVTKADPATGLGLYVRAIAHALIRHGHPKSEAIAIAIGAVKRWSSGRGKVHPSTRAKAAAAVAHWEAIKAKSHLSREDQLQLWLRDMLGESGSAGFLLPQGVPATQAGRIYDLLQEEADSQAHHPFTGTGTKCELCDHPRDHEIHQDLRTAYASPEHQIDPKAAKAAKVVVVGSKSVGRLSQPIVGGVPKEKPQKFKEWKPDRKWKEYDAGRLGKSHILTKEHGPYVYTAHIHVHPQKVIHAELGSQPMNPTAVVERRHKSAPKAKAKIIATKQLADVDNAKSFCEEKIHQDLTKVAHGQEEGVRALTEGSSAGDLLPKGQPIPPVPRQAKLIGPHPFKGDGETCEECGKPHDDPIHEETRDWKTWDEEHPYQRIGHHRRLTPEEIDSIRKSRAEASGLDRGKRFVGHTTMNDSEYEAHRQHVEYQTVAHGSHDLLRSPWSTHNSEDRVGGVEGVYTRDRAAQHEEIIQHFLHESRDVPSEHRAIIMGGMGGAGKSTILRRMAQSPHSVAGKFGIKYSDYDEKGDGVGEPSNFMTLNPDMVKEEMVKRGMVPKVDHLSPMEATTFVHEEASKITDDLARRAQNQGKNVLWDITLNSTKSGDKRLKALHDLGDYHVSSAFVDVSTAQSVKNAAQRHRGGQDRWNAGIGPGGRYVESDLIKGAADPSGKYRSKNRAAFEDLKSQGKFHHTLTIDNENYVGKILDETGTEQQQIDLHTAQERAKARQLAAAERHNMAKHDLALAGARADGPDDLADALLAYWEGRMSLDDLKAFVGSFDFATPSYYQQEGATEADIEAVDHYEPNTWGEVDDAHNLGLLTDEEYQALADAVRDRAQPEERAAKMTKDEAGYREADPGFEHCTGCVHVLLKGDEDSTCDLVNGTVDGEHVCDYFDDGTPVTIRHAGPGHDPVPGGHAKTPPDKIRSARARYDRNVGAVEPEVERSMKELFGRQRKATVSRMTGDRGKSLLKRAQQPPVPPTDGTPEPASTPPTGSPPSISPDQVFDAAFWTNETVKALTPHYNALGVVAANTIQHSVNAPADINDGTALAAVKDVLAKRMEKAAYEITDTTRAKITQALQQGIAEGEGVAQIAKRINEIFDNADSQRAAMIAQTETIGAINEAAQAYAENLPEGVVGSKTWLSHLDTRTRPHHRAANGQEVPVHTPFYVGGFAMMHPGDQTAPPSETVNCRCGVAYLPPGMSPKNVITAKSLEGLVPETTINELKKAKKVWAKNAKVVASTSGSA